MEKKEYLNEEEYQKNNAKIKKVGKIALIIGAVVLVIGIVLLIIGVTAMGATAVNGMDIFGENTINMSGMQKTAGGMFGSFGLIAIGGFLNFIGFIIMVVGGIAYFIAHGREITAYTTQQTMPIAQEGIEKMTPTISSSVGSIAKEVTKGIKEGLNEDEINIK
ncbi:MAG: hypothetical protein RR067_05265 [Bacilli bacterium]